VQCLKISPASSAACIDWDTILSHGVFEAGIPLAMELPRIEAWMMLQPSEGLQIARPNTPLQSSHISAIGRNRRLCFCSVGSKSVLQPSQIQSAQSCAHNWVWINTYENTIFRGMNIHFNPAILMWTTGVQGFDTLPTGKSPCY
jgi:hypothetical protein